MIDSNNKNKIYGLAEKSAFYQQRITEDYYNNIAVSKPLLEKRDIQNFGHIILNSDYKNLDINSLLVSRTSGSTGEPLEVFWLPDDFMKSNLCLWRLRKKYYGIDSTSKFVSFHSIIYNKSKPIKNSRIMLMKNGINLSFSKFHLTSNDMTAYFIEMEKFSPEWLMVQPSVAFEIMDYCKKQKKRLSNTIKYIELNGETILQIDEKKLKDFFNVPVANMYGCNEVNAIGYECPFGNMHILTANVVLQLADMIEDEQGFSGNAIVTSIHNTAFPILGYNLGDSIHLSTKHRCSCGNDSPIIDQIIGRQNEHICLKSGKKIDLFLFTNCIETVNSYTGNPIKQFKVISRESSIEILLHIEEAYRNWEKTIATELIRQCSEQFGEVISIYVKFCYCPINISEAGKYKWIEHKNDKEAK